MAPISVLRFKVAVPETEAGRVYITIYLNFCLHLHLNFISRKRLWRKLGWGGGGVGVGNETLNLHSQSLTELSEIIRIVTVCIYFLIFYIILHLH